MRDVSFIVLIILWWVFLSFMLSEVFKDSLIASETLQGNQSYGISTEINANKAQGINFSYMEAVNYNDVGVKGFWDMFARIFTFRIPSVNGFPVGLTFFVSAFNWILVGIFFLLLYRQIRSGGG